MLLVTLKRSFFLLSNDVYLNNNYKIISNEKNNKNTKINESINFVKKKSIFSYSTIFNTHNTNSDLNYEIKIEVVPLI